MAARPLVLGHRGASRVAPENTVEAFTRARELGANGAELDVRRTADGVLVVHHDAAIAGVGAVFEMTFAALRAERPELATLDEALAALSGLVVNAEVKCLAWEPDADHDGSVMRATLDMLQSHTASAGSGAVVVSSFELVAVDRAREYAPGIATAWLTHGQPLAKTAPLVSQHGHRWLNPDVVSALAAGPAGIAAAHDAGLQVSVWTVDDPDDARALAAAGVDIIITNVPDVVIAAIS